MSENIANLDALYFEDGNSSPAQPIKLEDYFQTQPSNPPQPAAPESHIRLRDYFRACLRFVLDINE